MKASLRVFFTTHHDGRLTGKLLRRRHYFFGKPPPSAWGATEAEILDRLDELLQQRLTEEKEEFEDYQFEDSFETRTLSVDVHPITWHDKAPIIGREKLSVKVTYGAAPLPEGAWLAVVPKFDWWLRLEDRAMAEEVIREGIGAAFRRTASEELYEFRQEGREYILAWTPQRARPKRVADESEDDEPDHLPAISAVADELVRGARRGTLAPLLIDPQVVQPVLDLVLTEPRPSLLLVGGPGVGKTAWVLQLANRLVVLRREGRKELPRLWRTSADRIIAGMTYLGMWQERCLEIVRELSNEADYVHVDHLVDLLKPQADGASIGEIFGPAIISGEMSVIAECTPSELERAQRLAPSLVNAMHIVRLEEPPAASIPALLQTHLARRSRHTILTPEGLAEAARLLAVFQRDQLFPGKAFRFLDWLVRHAPDATLSARQVVDAFARFSGLPAALISTTTAVPRAAIAGSLQRAVIGQDAACHAAAGVLARFKAGLNDPEKPIGALLFTGPTGVGKTELAKELARYIFGNEDRLVRIDSSEYAVPGAAQRLLAVGQNVRSLAEEIRRQPLSLVLIDEVEKAHPEVFDLLLGMLGEGRLTDGSGRLVDFRMTVIVLTSNLGVSLRDPVGFGGGGSDDFLHAVREHFRPELVNRLDGVIPFQRLGPDHILRIVDLELAKTAKRMGFVRRDLTLAVDDDAKERLAQLGYDPKMGARPLRRVMEQEIVAPMARILAADPGMRGRTLRASLREGAISIGVEAAS